MNHLVYNFFNFFNFDHNSSYNPDYINNSVKNVDEKIDELEFKVLQNFKKLTKY